MPVYTDAIDIRQHLRGASGVSVPNINEIMEEVEAYIAAELDLGDTLPAGNPVLKSMVREFSMARVILDLLPANSENVARTQLHDARGRMLLQSARREGITPSDKSTRNFDAEVVRPRIEPFWQYDRDFNPDYMGG